MRLLTDAFNVGRFAHVVPQNEELVDLNKRSLEERTSFLNAVPDGKHLTLYGYYLRVSPLHLRPRELDVWRQVGDDLADNAFRALTNSGLATGADLLALASTNKAANALVQDMSTVPPWVNFDRIARGQAFLRRNLPFILINLFNLSLLGGFGAGKINSVLHATGYLSSNDRDRSHRRLLETVQLTLDCGYEGGLAVGQKTWMSALGVRLLHAGVRVKVMQHGTKPRAAHHSRPAAEGGAAAGGTTLQGVFSPDKPVWDVQELGVPINMEDMLVTQLAFSIVVLMGMERLGLLWHESQESCEDYLHLWTYVAHLLGTRLPSPELVQQAQTLKGAQALLESVVSHIVYPNELSRPLVLSTIRAVAYRAPVAWNPRTEVAVARAIAGEAYADGIGLPRVDDPVLDEVIRDDYPTTSLTVELQYVQCANPDLAIDAHRHNTGAGRAAEQSWWTLRGLERRAALAATLALRYFLILPVTTVLSVISTGSASSASAHSWWGDASGGGQPVTPGSAVGAPASPGCPSTAVAAEAGLAALRPLHALPYLFHLPGLSTLLGWMQLKRMSALVEYRLGGRTDFRLRYVPGKKVELGQK